MLFHYDPLLTFFSEKFENQSDNQKAVKLLFSGILVNVIIKRSPANMTLQLRNKVILD